MSNVNISNTSEAPIRQEKLNKLLTRHHKPNVKYERVKTEATTKLVDDAGATNTAVPDDEADTPGKKAKKTSKAKNGAKVKNGAATTQTEKKKKPRDDTPSLLWAEHMLSGRMGVWAANEQSGYPLTYCWNSRYWELIDENKGRAKAASWLRHAMRGAAKASIASDAWKFSELLLQDEKPLPVCSETDVVMPVQNAYLFVEPDTSIRVIKPDEGVRNFV